MAYRFQYIWLVTKQTNKNASTAPTVKYKVICCAEQFQTTVLRKLHESSEEEV